jgi:succinoglycan biosynthesis transport protein ExoP
MELQNFLVPVKRWWWLLVAAAAVAAFFSLLAGLRQPPLYRSSATVMIGRAIEDPNPSDPQFYTSQRLAATYAAIAARQPIQEAVKAALGLSELPEYVVRPLPNTQLVEIVVSDTDPIRTQAVAAELANQLILQSPTSRPEDAHRQAFIDRQLDDLQVKIQATQDEIDGRQSELANLSSARQISDKHNQINALQSRLDTLRDNYTDLLANSSRGAMNTISVIEPAVLPARPIGPNVFLMVVAAVVFALAVALGAVYLLAYLDDTVQSPEEIKHLTDLPMLAGVPAIAGEGYPDKLIASLQPRSLVTEVYRSLRTSVQFCTIDQTESTVLLVTSPNPSEGKSLVVANLAVVIAQTGCRVLVMDSDLRRPVLQEIFGLDNHTGLTEYLRSYRASEPAELLQDRLTQAIHGTPEPGLYVMTSGPVPPNPSELLGSSTYHQLLDELKRRFDYIILDSPPVLAVTDAAVLSARVDGTVLVIDAEKTPKNQLRQSVERLREVNAKILGVVVNRVTPRMDGYRLYYPYRYPMEKVSHGNEGPASAFKEKLSALFDRPKSGKPGASPD